MANYRRLLLKDASEIKTVAENHLGNQVVRRPRHTHTEPKIDFPFAREIQVNGGEDFLLLLADCVETRNRAQRAVVFDSTPDFLGEIIAKIEVGCEDEALVYAPPVERTVKRRTGLEI